mmetsp:Transcript_5309/g.19865  ORF Transcript_5309/g.19865 Transcript_5309/m.19865 type:complete len:115 (+) Transcript_5309:102-446(+)
MVEMQPLFSALAFQVQCALVEARDRVSFFQCNFQQNPPMNLPADAFISSGVSYDSNVPLCRHNLCFGSDDSKYLVFLRQNPSISCPELFPQMPPSFSLKITILGIFSKKNASLP